MRKRLSVAVAALVLGAQMGSPALQAEPSVEQLTTIASLIDAGDLEALILYIGDHPELLEGDSLVARRLREFMAAAQDMATYLAFDPPIRRALASRLLTDGGGEPEEEGSSLY